MFTDRFHFSIFQLQFQNRSPARTLQNHPVRRSVRKAWPNEPRPLIWFHHLHFDPGGDARCQYVLHRNFNDINHYADWNVFPYWNSWSHNYTSRLFDSSVCKESPCATPSTPSLMSVFRKSRNGYLDSHDDRTCGK